jgi:hypothetical protein
VAAEGGLTTRRRPERKPKPRRSSSEGFRPVKQVGVAVSIGFPLMMIGLMILFVTISIGGDTPLWFVSGGLILGGVIASMSNSVI